MVEKSELLLGLRVERGDEELAATNPVYGLENCGDDGVGDDGDDHGHDNNDYGGDQGRHAFDFFVQLFVVAGG